MQLRKHLVTGLLLAIWAAPCSAQDRTFARVHTRPAGARVYQMDGLAQAVYLGQADAAVLDLNTSVPGQVHLAFVYQSPFPLRSMLDGWLGPASPDPSFAADSECVRQGWTIRDQAAENMGPYNLPLKPVDRLIEWTRIWGWIPGLGLALTAAWWLRQDRVQLNLCCEPADLQVMSQDGSAWMGSAQGQLWVDRKKLGEQLVLQLQSPGYSPRFESIPSSALKKLRRNQKLRWPVHGTLQLEPESESSPPWELRPGHHIASYRIEARLGEGVSAVVYRVHCPRQGALALKLLKPAEVRGHDTWPRFQREMRALSRLQHPNIPYLSDYGEYQGMLFLCMELLDGEPLQPGSEVKTGLRQLRQLASALAYAHERGVLHRDIKPSNVIVHPEKGLRLTDFGLARSHDSTTLTVEGTLLGTPAYMAPEVISGQPFEAASDQYSLGCLAFELFAGRQVFSGEAPLAVLMQHVGATPADLREICPELPQDVSDHIARMLAKAPADRLPGLQPLLEVLDAHNA